MYLNEHLNKNVFKICCVVVVKEKIQSFKFDISKNFEITSPKLFVLHKDEKIKLFVQATNTSRPIFADFLLAFSIDISIFISFLPTPLICLKP